MNYKQSNYETGKKFMTREYWLPEYSDMFSENFTIDFPNAPPGMPQHLDEFDAELFRNWLSRTVKSWSVKLEEFYGTADPDVFWAVRVAGGDVFWGGKDGRFQSKMIARIEFENSKIKYLKEMFDPLQFLKAINADVPVFRMDIYHEKIDRFLAERGAEQKAPEKVLDTSPEAVKQRIENSLSAFMHGDYWEATSTLATYAEGYNSFVWFLPPEMDNSYSEEEMPRVEAWSMLSCPVITFDRRGRYWNTDEPGVYFAEYKCSGETDWLGNNCPGRYRNQYFYILRFDEAGRITCCEEFLNPINKFNSINTSLPSFPYYF